MLFEPVSTFLTWLVVGIALALPATLLVLLSNANELAEGVNIPARFSLFLDESTTLEQAEEAARAIERRVDISQVIVLDRVTALADFALRPAWSRLLNPSIATRCPTHYW